MSIDRATNGNDYTVQTYRVRVEWDEKTRGGFLPTLVESGTLDLAWLCTGFFGLSFAQHMMWVLLGGYDCSIEYLWRNIDHCICWWRWVEYFFSSSLMAVAVAVTVGIRETYTLASIAALTATTMLFGLLTEFGASPELCNDNCKENLPFKEIKELYTLTRNETQQVTAKEEAIKFNTDQECPGGTLPVLPKYNLNKWRDQRDCNPNCIDTSWISRLVPHFCGWVPYSMAWYIILSHFDHAVRDHDASQNATATAEDEVPEFVRYVVYGTAVIFTLFSIVQIRYQASEPERYWETELWYNLLSATAKLYLGGYLYWNVLYLDCFNEAFGSDGCFDR